MRKILILGAALALAGCAGQALTTNSALYAVTSAYAAADLVASGYVSLPSADPSIKADIKRLDEQAYNAVQPVAAAEAAGGSGVTVAEMEAAQAAVTALTNYMTQHGVK